MLVLHQKPVYHTLFEPFQCRYPSAPLLRNLSSLRPVVVPSPLSQLTWYTHIDDDNRITFAEFAARNNHTHSGHDQTPVSIATGSDSFPACWFMRRVSSLGLLHSTSRIHRVSVASSLSPEVQCCLSFTPSRLYFLVGLSALGTNPRSALLTRDSSPSLRLALGNSPRHRSDGECKSRTSHTLSKDHDQTSDRNNSGRLLPRLFRVFTERSLSLVGPDCDQGASCVPVAVTRFACHLVNPK